MMERGVLTSAFTARKPRAAAASRAKGGVAAPLNWNDKKEKEKEKEKEKGSEWKQSASATKNEADGSVLDAEIDEEGDGTLSGRGAGRRRTASVEGRPRGAREEGAAAQDASARAATHTASSTAERDPERETAPQRDAVTTGEDSSSSFAAAIGERADPVLASELEEAAINTTPRPPLLPQPSPPKRRREEPAEAAHVRYAHTVAVGQPLPLPPALEVLVAFFEALETTCRFFLARGETCIFAKMQRPIENLCHRAVSIEMLAQLCTLYPEAYTYEPVWWADPERRGQRTPSVCVKLPALDAGGTNRDRHPLTVRLAELRARLVDWVAEAHAAFCATLPYAVPASWSTAGSGALQRWHPKFDLSTVPAVPLAPLPVPADAHAAPISAGMLVRSVPGAAPAAVGAAGAAAKVRAAIATAAAATRASPEAPPMPAASEPASKAAPAKAGSLLERIRAKERQQAADAMHGVSPVQQQRALLLSRLPNLVDAALLLYTTEGRKTLYEENLLARLAENHHTRLSLAEVRAHLDLLLEVAPGWLVRTDVTGSHSAVYRLAGTLPVADVKARIASAHAHATHHRP